MSEMKEKKSRKPFFYRVIYTILKAFTPKYALDGVENLPKDKPCVFVGNHCQMYGPLAAVFYMKNTQLWCIGDLMDNKNVAKYAYQDFWSMKPKAFRWFYKILAHVFGRLLVYVFTNAPTIPVYYDQRTLTTFRKTVAALEQGKNVIIYPECRTYKNNVINEYRSNFIDLARLYGRRGGDPLTFVPVYVAPKKGKVVFGSSIEYDKNNAPDVERERVCQFLMEQTTNLALSMPRHKVVPYVNAPTRKYMYNTPLVELSEETAPFFRKKKQKRLEKQDSEKQ